MIDWNKPIRVRGDERPVHVVSRDYRQTPESDPVVLIAVKSPFEGWDVDVIQRTQDNRLTAQHTFGNTLVFENIPERHHTFRAVFENGIVSIPFSELEKLKAATGADFAIEQIFENDELVEVKVHKL